MTGHSGDAIRGKVRSSRYSRISHGLYLPVRRGEATPSLRVRELAATRLVLPPASAFTHVTAAWLRSWWLPRLPEQVPIFATTTEARRPRRAGLICSRLPRLSGFEEFEGLPVTPPDETLLACARDLSVLDLTVMVDAALRSGVEIENLWAFASHSRPGVRNLRRAIGLADSRSESPFETLLRLFHLFAEVAVEPQMVIRDHRGNFVARADLWVVGTNFIHEYDGAHHDGSTQGGLDRRRERRLAETAYRRRGFDARDLFETPLATLQEIDRTIGRQHRPQRLSRWRREVASSSYSVAGRARLHNRWLKNQLGTDWSRSA